MEKSTTTASDLLDAPRALQLVETLRATMRDVADRQKNQERDFATRIAKLKSQFDAATSNVRDEAEAGIGAIDSGATERRSALKAAFERRKARVTRAYATSHARRLKQIEADESQRTLEIQHALIGAERRRDADIKAAEAKRDAFSARLTEENVSMQKTEAAAQFAFGGYGSLKRLLVSPPDVKLDTSGDEGKLLEQFRERISRADSEIARSKRLVLPLLFRVFPLWLCLMVAIGVSFAVIPPLRRLDFASVTTANWLVLFGAVAAIVILYLIGRALAASSARATAVALEEARRSFDAAAAKSQATFNVETEHARRQHAGTAQSLNADWKEIQLQARTLRNGWDDRLGTQSQRAHATNLERFERLTAAATSQQRERLAQTRAAADTRLKELQASHADNLRKLEDSLRALRESIATDINDTIVPSIQRLKRSADAAAVSFPAWPSRSVPQFDLPRSFLGFARFGELRLDIQKLSGVALESFGAGIQGDREIVVPLLVSTAGAGSILFETRDSGHSEIIGALNSLILRLLTVAPPGNVAFTIFDPVGLGQNFAGIMHLADFEERVINSRIWTQQQQFEERLRELNEHIEKVTQMYLRNEYATLAEYNAQAGRLAEKHQFLVIADFPVNFSDVAVKRLQNIIASGPRCGVHTLIHWDQRRQPPLELVPEEMRKNAVCLTPRANGFAVAGTDWDGATLVLDAPPDAEAATALLHKIGKASTDSYRVEMPFAEVAPSESEIWSLDTTKELRVPIGRTGATKLQYLALGQGTRQHGLVAGKTGSGKSTLFHVVITNLSLWCSPDQVEFYLVDFKKGVEFKTYATHKLPHARVIAIESDREFGLSVLQRVDDELKRRGDLFRKLGAQDIAGYKRAGGNEPMPRVLLLIDEFQELFVEDDRVSQAAALLLDRIVRQGRAFGIHVLLGSQTLGGAYTLARATIGQMVVRIALQCNEADAYLIMTEDNPAPRLLSRPGEAIYNDDGGAIQGNSPFQIVWLPDQERDVWLAKASQRVAGILPGNQKMELPAGRWQHLEPVVFEGNAPADIRDNPLLQQLLRADKITPTRSPRIWLGAPNSIKGPTEAVFHRQSGNHLLIVGQREEAALSMLVAAQIALAAQSARSGVKMFVFDCSPPDSAESRALRQTAGSIGDRVRLVGASQTQETIIEIGAELDRRDQGADAPALFLLVHGLQQNKKLRFDEEASFSLDADAGATHAGLLFNKIVTEGANRGIHVIATCDTYNNVMRMMSRKAVSEFEMRVVFQMSANDSASLIETPAANNLGLHRAILHNGQQGWTETFRPYALPDVSWLNEVAAALKRAKE